VRHGAVKVHNPGAMPRKDGRGVFAEALLERFPNLPVEEEGRLCDPHLRDNFVERVFAYHRLRSLFAGRWTVGALVAFHTAHKLQLLAHAPQAYEALGRLVAGAKALARDELRRRYEDLFMQGLKTIATARRNSNVCCTSSVTSRRRSTATRAPNCSPDRGLPQGARAARRTDHADPPLGARPRRPLPRRPDVPRAAPQGTHAPHHV